jgi:hypothetical protein
MSRSSSATMTAESGGPSDSTHSGLPLRPIVLPAPQPAPSRNIGALIRNAVSTGTAISGILADELRQGALVNNQEHNLQDALTLAEQLRNYQSPVEFTIGLVGDSGVGKCLIHARTTSDSNQFAGKSSLINSLLKYGI